VRRSEVFDANVLAAEASQGGKSGRGNGKLAPGSSALAGSKREGRNAAPRKRGGGTRRWGSHAGGQSDASDAGGRSSPDARVGAGMLSFSGSLRVFVAVEACDMRKGFEGLSALVGSVLKEEVKSGALFCFSNRRRTRLKILYWDGSG